MIYKYDGRGQKCPVPLIKLRFAQYVKICLTYFCVFRRMILQISRPGRI